MPMTSHPRPMAESTAARMTALRPGASPPPVDIAILIRVETVFGRCLSARGAEKTHDFAGGRVASELRFLEHRVPVPLHFEAPATRRDQLDSRVGKRLTKLRRQTGGARLVASDGAVLDRDRHGCPCWPPPFASVTRLGAVPHRAPAHPVRLFQFAIALSASAHEPCVW